MQIKLSDRRVGRGLAIGGAVLAGAGLLAGCSNASSSSSTTSGAGTASSAAATAAASGSPSAASGSAAPSDMTAFNEVLYAGTSTAPSGDVLPIEPGKKVFIVSCGQALQVCADSVEFASQAAEAAGWTTTVYDTQADPAKFAAGVNQGIAAKPDAMILMSIDCSLVKNPIQSAIDAGIKVVTLQSIDCSDQAGGGGPSLYKDREPKIEGADTFADWNRTWMEERVPWIVANAGPDAHVLQLDEPEYPLYVTNTEGAAAGFKKYCPGCTVTNMEYSFADAGSKLQQKIETALLKDPSINVIFAPDNATVLSGVSGAVQASGRGDKILVVGAGGEKDALDLIKSGVGLNATYTIDTEWWGWSAVDTLNSMFHDAAPRPSGLGTQLIDSTNIANFPNGYTSSIDFKDAYKKLWGLSN